MPIGKSTKDWRNQLQFAWVLKFTIGRSLHGKYLPKKGSVMKNMFVVASKKDMRQDCMLR